jgi:hypothetical protein
LQLFIEQGTIELLLLNDVDWCSNHQQTACNSSSNKAPLTCCSSMPFIGAAITSKLLAPFHHQTRHH